MRLLALTIDVDRDSNVAVPGDMCARSSRPGGPGPATFDASIDGLEAMLSSLESTGTPATMFLEGRTASRAAEAMDLEGLVSGHAVCSHGVDHEDLTGEDSGLVLDDVELRDVLERSSSMIEGATGRRPTGFRAPYLHCDDRVLGMLRGCGYSYDSSLTVEMDRKSMPWTMPDGIVEFPVARSRDLEGKRIWSYLWPMHESRRGVSDYVGLAERMDEGVLVIATHSWHLMQDSSGNRHPGCQVGLVEDVVAGIEDAGLRPVSLDQAMRLI